MTWRLRRDITELSMPERMAVAACIRHFSGVRYQLYAWVVMNDHVHVALRPLDDHELSQILHSWKSFSTHLLAKDFERHGSVWVGETWDRIVRSEEELVEKCQYILNNPAKRWPGIEEYPACGWV